MTEPGEVSRPAGRPPGADRGPPMVQAGRGLVANQRQSRDLRAVLETLAACELLLTKLHALENAPKTIAWRMRARVGRRVRWYEVPEEVVR
jgi:hypothetical protein